MDSGPVFHMSSETKNFVAQEAAGQSHVIRRSRMETSIDILRAIGAGAQKPTHIMYRANLSWVVMREYIENLEKQGLVVTGGTPYKKEYGLTQRGFQVLDRINSVREQLALTAGGL